MGRYVIANELIIMDQGDKNFYLLCAFIAAIFTAYEVACVIVNHMKLKKLRKIASLAEENEQKKENFLDKLHKEAVQQTEGFKEE